MTGKRGRGGAEHLSLHNEGAGASITEAPRKAASRPKRRIPRKPTPAQIERFEALRARGMGTPDITRRQSSADKQKP